MTHHNIVRERIGFILINTTLPEVRFLCMY